MYKNISEKKNNNQNNNYNLNEICKIITQKKNSRPSTSQFQKIPKNSNDCPLQISVFLDKPVLTPKEFFTSLLSVTHTFISSLSYSLFTSSASETEIFNTQNINIMKINEILFNVPYFIINDNNLGDNDITDKIRKYSLPTIPKQNSKLNIDNKSYHFIFNKNNQSLIDKINQEEVKKIWKISISLIFFNITVMRNLADFKEEISISTKELNRLRNAAAVIQMAYYR